MSGATYYEPLWGRMAPEAVVRAICFALASGCGSTDPADLSKPSQCDPDSPCGDGSIGSADAGSGGGASFTDANDAQKERTPSDGSTDGSPQRVQCLPGHYVGSYEAKQPDGGFYSSDGPIEFTLLPPDGLGVLVMESGTMARNLRPITSMGPAVRLRGQLDCSVAPPVFDGRIVNLEDSGRASGELRGTVDPSNNAGIYGPYEWETTIDLREWFTLRGSWRAERTP